MNTVIFILIYLLLCVLIAWIFEWYGDNFWRIFFWSLVCTPMWGMIIGLFRFSDSKYNRRLHFRKNR